MYYWYSGSSAILEFIHFNERLFNSSFNTAFKFGVFYGLVKFTPSLDRMVQFKSRLLVLFLRAESATPFHSVDP